jgi:hypothetical protein
VPNNTFEGLPAPITSPPSREELAGRLTNVQARMHSAELDFYVSFNPVNIYYLTNFANYVHERPFLLVIPREGVPITGSMSTVLSSRTLLRASGSSLRCQSGSRSGRLAPGWSWTS